MAVDKLVDSAKLNAALDYEASKIIAKGGGTAPLAFDFENEKGFGDYIDAIPSGGGGTYQNIFVSDFTPASATSNITFSVSDIGFVPDFCVYYAKDFVKQESYNTWTTMAYEGADLLVKKGTCQGYTKTGSVDYTSSPFRSSETNVTLPRYNAWQAGTTYSLVLGKIKE